MQRYNINSTDIVDHIDHLTSVCLPQVGGLGQKPTEVESATLGPLSCDQEIVTGPGETRAAVLE